MTIIKQAVERLDRMEESLAQVLIQLGAKHPYKADFSPAKVAVFNQAVLSVWKSVLQDKMTPECTVAWKTLFEYIMSKLRQGFFIGQSVR